MIFSPCPLDGVFLVEPEPRRDERGFLARTYCENEFSSHGLKTHWVQQNHTMTLNRGSVRGMHWQTEPKPQMVKNLSARDALLPALHEIL